MKKYGIWKVILQTVSGEVVKHEVTATSGKNARARIEKLYEGCVVFKMTRVEWLTYFSYAQLSSAILDACPTRGLALLDILRDNGVFSIEDKRAMVENKAAMVANKAATVD